MSRPPINPDKSVSGIALDPQTLERVIPESRRPDGSVRKQIKIRPGFTPQEDVRRFRGTKQAQMDANTLPKGHIIGWAPPSAESASAAKPLSKSAKKNAKRREKKAEKKEVPEDWEEEEEGDGSIPSTVKGVRANGSAPSTKENVGSDHKQDTPNWAAAPDTECDPTTVGSSEDKLASAVKKLAL